MRFDYLMEFVRHLPLQAIAGGLVPIVPFTANKLGTLQSVHQKHQLRQTRASDSLPSSSFATILI